MFNPPLYLVVIRLLPVVPVSNAPAAVPFRLAASYKGVWAAFGTG
jgi:hypothetical protein